MMKRAMAAAFDRWLEQASEGIRLRGALARAVQKMAKRAAAGAFARWAAGAYTRPLLSSN